MQLLTAETQTKTFHVIARHVINRFGVVRVIRMDRLKVTFSGGFVVILSHDSALLGKKYYFSLQDRFVFNSQRLIVSYEFLIEEAYAYGQQ